jgi:hypothetical protein
MRTMKSKILNKKTEIEETTRVKTIRMFAIFFYVGSFSSID